MYFRIGKETASLYRRSMLYGVLTVILLCSGTSMAGEGRTLGGYRFIPSLRVEDPFVTHHFQNSTGISIASNVDVPILVYGTPPDTLLSLSGSVFYVGPTFSYQHVVHHRAAVRISARVTSRVGTSGEALLSQGVSALMDAGLGTTVELWRNQSVLLSGLLDFGFGKALLVDLIGFAEEVVTVGPEEASILTTDNGATTSAGLGAAWAPNGWSGVTVIGQLGYSKIETRDDDMLWRIAGSGSVDFGQNDKAPIALLITMDVDRLRPRPVAGGTAVGVGFGIFYTGREDLNLGIEGQWSHFPQSTHDITINPASFDLVLRYYF